MKLKYAEILAKLRANTIAQAVAFPFLNKRPILLLLCSSILTTILPPFTSYMYPTAEDALKREGLDPKIAAEIAPGQKIRVEKGPLAVILKDPGAFFPLIRAATDIRDAYSFPDATTRGTMSLFNRSGNCIVNMGVFSSFTSHEIISLFNGIPAKDILNSPISEKEFYNYVLLHEMNHCAKSNTGVSLEREGYADYRAATIAAREFKNPEILTWAFNARAASFPTGDSHDIALYLDAKLNKRDMPTPEQITEANIAAGKFIAENYATSSTSSLPPLTAKRVKMYNKAQDYFRNPPRKKDAPKKPVGSGPKVS